MDTTLSTKTWNSWRGGKVAIQEFIFFLEYAGDLHIIALRRIVYSYTNFISEHMHLSMNVLMYSYSGWT